jgi:hypothetical protein
MPPDFGVRTNFAPKILNIFLRSSDKCSGRIRMSFNYRAAATNARPIPVFPEVGSMKVVLVVTFPDAKTSSNICTPIRSFTLLRGLKNSN